MKQPEPVVHLSVKYYTELLDKARLLDCLIQEGVKKWEGYQRAKINADDYYA